MCVSGWMPTNRLHTVAVLGLLWICWSFRNTHIFSKRKLNLQLNMYSFYDSGNTGLFKTITASFLENKICIFLKILKLQYINIWYAISRLIMSLRLFFFFLLRNKNGNGFFVNNKWTIATYIMNKNNVLIDISQRSIFYS